MPLRGIGGLSRLTREAALNMERTGKDLSISLNAFRSIPKARLRVLAGQEAAFEEIVDLDPSQTYHHVLPISAPNMKYRVDLLDPDGKVLLTHTEDSYAGIGLEEAKRIPENPLLKTPQSEAEFLAKGTEDEKLRDVLTALETYDQGLAKYPASAALQRAAGRAALGLNRFQEAIDRLLHLPPDPETYYYLGVAYLAVGEDIKARTALSAWREGSPFALTSRFQLAELGGARWGDQRNALAEVRRLIEALHDPPGSGALERSAAPAPRPKRRSIRGG